MICKCRCFKPPHNPENCRRPKWFWLSITFQCPKRLIKTSVIMPAMTFQVNVTLIISAKIVKMHFLISWSLQKWSSNFTWRQQMRSLINIQDSRIALNSHLIQHKWSWLVIKPLFCVSYWINNYYATLTSLIEGRNM